MHFIKKYLRLMYKKTKSHSFIQKWLYNQFSELFIVVAPIV